MKTKLHKHKSILPAAAAFFAAWASVRACNISTFHPLGGILFLMYFLLGRQFLQWITIRRPGRRHIITSVIISSLFTLFTLCADYEALLAGLDSRLFRLGYTLLISIGLYLVFYTLVLSFFLWTEGRTVCSRTDTLSSFAFYEKLPLISFVFCLLAWLPYLLNNYPGVMTVDSLNQYGQIIGQLPMSNHHPWVHTQLIRFFYETGMALTGDAITGLGLFTIFQMLVMAGIFAYLTDTFVTLHVRTGICLAVLAFYALLPYNAIYMVTMWKDILFSGMILLYSTILFRFLNGGFSPTYRTYLLYILSGFCMCLLRSNGFYAFLLTLPFLLICFYRLHAPADNASPRVKIQSASGIPASAPDRRQTFKAKEWQKQLLLNLAVLLLVLAVKGPVMTACQVASGDFVEALSIPVQMAARVYADEEPVSAEDEAMWKRIVDTSQIGETYESFCSDHMKNLIRQGDPAYLEAHKADYLKLWLRFGLAHPGAYLRGYIDATKGYWYPDVPNRIGSDERIAENPYGLTARPLFHNPVTIKIREIVFKLPDMVPLYGLLFSLGAMFWLCILLAGRTFISGRFRYLMVFLPNGAIIATLLLATPVNNEFRYAYSMLLTIPLFILCGCAAAPAEKSLSSQAE